MFNGKKGTPQNAKRDTFNQRLGRSTLAKCYVPNKEDIMYKKVSTDMNFVDREKETEKFWEDNHIFEKSMEDREGCPQYM